MLGEHFKATRNVPTLSARTRENTKGDALGGPHGLHIDHSVFGEPCGFLIWTSGYPRHWHPRISEVSMSMIYRASGLTMNPRRYCLTRPMTIRLRIPLERMAQS
jgi:hypothetical protein